MFKLFEVKNGKFTTLPDLSSKKIKGFIIGTITVLVVVSLSGWLHISEKDLWKFYNLLLQQFGLNDEEIRPNNQKEIEARIELGVDKAIRDVTPEYDRIITEADKNKYKPVYQDLLNDDRVCYTKECKALAPPMRICSPWVDTCSKD